MEAAATVALHALILAGLVALKYRATPQRLTPDCKLYAQFTDGERVPKPYCYRPLVPWLARLVAFVSPLHRHDALYFTVMAGNVAAVAAVYLLTLSLGGGAWSALCASVTLIATRAAFGAWTHWPLLVDSWALALGVGAVAVLPLSPIAAAVLLTLAALAKEAGWVLAAAFLLCLEPSLWWTPLPGLLVLALLRLRKPAPPTEDWMAPWHALKTKRAEWFDYGRNLGGLMATPWLVAYFLPGTPYLVAVAVVAVLAWAQTLLGNDHGRLIAAVAVFAIPALCVVLPPSWLVVYALSQLFWPFPVSELDCT